MGLPVGRQGETRHLLAAKYATYAAGVRFSGGVYPSSGRSVAALTSRPAPPPPRLSSEPAGRPRYARGHRLFPVFFDGFEEGAFQLFLLLQLRLLWQLFHLGFTLYHGIFFSLNI